jgi:hypothetical protein
VFGSISKDAAGAFSGSGDFKRRAELSFSPVNAAPDEGCGKPGAENGVLKVFKWVTGASPKAVKRCA